MTARVVVVGSGIAGLVAALHAADAGCRVTLVTKDALDHGSTRFAQGGIAAAVFADDSVDEHLADTLTAGAGLADERAARVLVSEGGARIRELIDLGVAFDRDADGTLTRGLEAAHSRPRVLHAGGDATGAAIEQALLARVRAADIAIIEHAVLADLVLDGDAVRAVDLLLPERAAPVSLTHSSAAKNRAHATPERRRVGADAVVLATGGAGRLYAHTTNPPVATGDGIAAALRAGAIVRDLEFVQFHPTVLEASADAEPFLVSEAVRGEGAVLIDDTGRRFAFDAHPDGELAPRDVVARAIVRAAAAQHGRPVRLDATALGARFLARRFPTIDRATRARGLDWGREPIPVTPAAHYMMGGVATDLWGRTSVRGLYAVGEVARTGVHGANRLASNSLLEGAVFAARAGDAIASDAASGFWPVAPAPAPHARASSSPSADAPPFSRQALQELMWRHAGLVRTGAGLDHAAGVIARWEADAAPARSVPAHEDASLLRVAREVVDAARRRTASVGAHFRSDDATAPTTPRPAEAVAAC